MAQCEAFNCSKIVSLAGVVQWIEHQPANQNVTISIPSLGQTLGLWARSPVGGHIRSYHALMLLSLSPSLPLSKNK